MLLNAIAVQLTIYSVLSGRAFSAVLDVEFPTPALSVIEEADDRKRAAGCLASFA
jgi:hypothetical protein